MGDSRVDSCGACVCRVLGTPARSACERVEGVLDGDTWC